MIKIIDKDLKSMRLGLGMTLPEVASKTYLTKQTISNIELKKIENKSTEYLIRIVLSNLYSNFSEEDINIRISMGELGISVKSKNDIEVFKKKLAQLTSSIMQ